MLENDTIAFLLLVLLSVSIGLELWIVIAIMAARFDKENEK